MKTRPFAALAALAFVLALAGCARSDVRAQSAFEGRLDDWTHEIVRDNPEMATSAGLTEAIAGAGFAARLTDRSGEAVERRRTAAVRRLTELRSLDADALTPGERVSHAILSAQFDAAAGAAAYNFGRFDPMGGASPYVLNQLETAFLELPEFFDTRAPLRTMADAEAYVARLGQVARAIDAETERARADASAGVTPPDFMIDRTLAALQTLIDTAPTNQLYVTSFRTRMATFAPGPQPGAVPSAAYERAQTLSQQAETIARDQIAPAYLRAAAFLRSIRAQASPEPGVWRLPGGEAYYRALLRIETTTDLSPAEIHQIGLDRVRTLTQELDIALRRLGHAQGPASTRLAALTADPRYQYADSDEGRAQLIADVERRVASVMRLAPRWFERLPRSEVQVRRVPAYAEDAAPGAYYEAPSLDGRTPGIYYLNLRNLSELTRIDLRTQDYHEAVPGHHFQIALARENENIPVLRRLMGFNAYAEGWALYAEQLADEQGFYETDLVGRVGYLRWQLWRAARLVVDTGMHAMRWNRAQAIAYLTEVTADTPGVIVSEVERYAVWPGQACGYEIGRRAIAEARETARNRLGTAFDLRRFHNMVLAEGEMPMPVLAAQNEAWIAASRR